MVDTDDAATGEAQGAWAGFRLFSVPEAMDSALMILRREPGTFWGLSALGVGPLGALILALEYFGVTRRLFERSYEYDYLLLAAALLLPVLLGWKSLCGLAQVYAGLEALRRDTLGERRRAMLGPIPLGGVMRQALRRVTSAVFAEFVRDLVVWVPVIAVGVLLGTVDPTMDGWVRGILIVVYALFGIPVMVVVSGFTLLMLPRASGLDRRGGMLRGVWARSFGATFTLGAMAFLLFLNLHLGIGLVLYLMDALLAVDVSYWEKFFSMSHRLYAFGLILVTLLLSEPLFRLVPALVWVDALVRRDVLDLTGLLDEVREGHGRRVAGTATAQNPSAQGDRDRLGPPASAGVLVLCALAAALALLGASPSAWAQPGEDGQEGQDGGVTSDELRAGRQLIVGEGDEYIDLWKFQEYVRERKEVASNAEEQAYWEELLAHAEEAGNTWGDDRAHAIRLLRARLDGPTLDADAPARVQVDREEVSASVKAILEGDAFKDLAGGKVERDNVDLGFERKRPRNRDWECEEEKPAGASGPELPSFSAPPGAFKVIGVVLLVLVVGLLGYVLVRRFLDRGEEEDASGLAPLPVVGDIAAQEPGREDVLAFTFGDWQARAEALAQAGDYRLAIRCLYLALLVTLHRRELIGYEPQSTNWEYERELRRALALRARPGEEVVVEAFGEVTRAFELVWYGEYAADAAGYGRCRQELDRIARSSVLEGAEGGGVP